MLSFASAGRVTLRGDFGVVPIDVAIVAQPDALLIYGELFTQFHLAVDGSVGDDPVAGITASWELQPSEHLDVVTPLTGVREIVFQTTTRSRPRSRSRWGPLAAQLGPDKAHQIRQTGWAGGDDSILYGCPD